MNKFIKNILHPVIISFLMILIIILLRMVSLNIDFLDPIETTLSDIEFTDLAFSRFGSPEGNSVDTNIVIINLGKTREEIVKQISICNAKFSKGFRNRRVF